ncbi:MAG: cytochrome oxidase subunit III [Opitutales bacterium]|nr:cytochrome oxidase subunit III [Opitutales bacterium]
MSLEVPIATTRSSAGIPTGRLGMWWVVASEVVIFGGLIVAYLLHRLGNPAWGGEAAFTIVPAGALNTLILLTSSYFVVVAHKAIGENQRERAFKFLWYTIACAGLFLLVKSYEYTTEITEMLHHDAKDGHTIGTFPVFWAFYFTATGLHAVHVIGGAVAIGIISFGVRKGENLQRVEYVGIYWHFVDVVWIFLFPLFYIAK